MAAAKAKPANMNTNSIRAELEKLRDELAAAAKFNNEYPAEDSYDGAYRHGYAAAAEKTARDIDAILRANPE